MSYRRRTCDQCCAVFESYNGIQKFCSRGCKDQSWRDRRKISDRMAATHWARKRRLVDYLGGACSTCGEDRLPCLQFHHRDPSTKLGHVTEMMRALNRWGWEGLFAEADKCDLVCANCHWVITAQSDWQAH